ncbi:Glycosyltransferase involved in cell wall bisynthesis [Microlunatus sagamiharensis]|uniref:Glycosyltransferase involved in cell wall bisynthesis n=1 Tax=Microlunatus sagamiharensis TaxID=546874 RepID=A0A1H2LXL7_9ACTN|nr:glycosyltransferase family 4 protein [Microlunatus sagamiharensis]SDU85351.1 Glycosyltransferase involved in cell wall bisynthesis [Microlunatus sagamiharensis]
MAEVSGGGPRTRVAMVLTASTGGIGRHAASVAPRLVGRGLDVAVCAPELTLEAHDLGVPTTPLSTRSLARAVRGADVVHAHGYKAAALALPHARVHRVPLVVTWHNAVLGEGRTATAGRLLQRLVARGADVVLAASEDLLDTALALGAREAELAPVAAPALAPPRTGREERRAGLRLAAHDVLVLTVTRLAPQKNLDLLLDVAARTRDRSDLAYALVGAGPLHDELARRVTAEALRVSLVGPTDDVASWLHAADLGLLPSRWEARALVAQEALLAGLPLVATRVGGVPGLVGDAAVLVDPDDPDGTAAAVLALVDDADARRALADAGLRQAATWPDEDDVADDLVRVYRHVLAGRGRTAP